MGESKGSEGEALWDTNEPIHGSAPLQMVQLLEQDKQNPSPITKEGRSELRIAKVARCLCGRRTSSPMDQENVSERAARICTPKAIVAIARKAYGGRLARAQSEVG